jgi:predicted transcriptional regulator
MAIDIITMVTLAVAGTIIGMSVVIYLFRTKDFSTKYVDIKEAPLHLNNALKDETKRDIIISLRKEKKYLTLIAKETNDSVAKTKYHLHELEKLGIIASMKLTREKFFLLTERGKMCLTAIRLYYPKNNFEKIMNRLKYGQLVWKEQKRKRNGFDHRLQ